MKIVPLADVEGSGLDFVRLSGGRAAISDATARRVADARRVGGLGDALAAVFRVTGIAALAKTYERVTGRDCGCARRRHKLNKWVPFHVEQSS